MGFYRNRIVPWLTHLAMRQGQLVAYRERVVPAAAGSVLEIGIGSGLNLPLYGRGVESVIGLDPSPALLEKSRGAARAVAFPVHLLEGSAEAVPLEDRSVDCVLTTWTLCTIPDPVRALREMRRVLRPDGMLLFVEHGQSPDRSVQRWQDRLTPAWRRCSGGCHLNRSIAGLIGAAGFRIDRMDTGYADGPKLMTFMYVGRARP